MKLDLKLFERKENFSLDINQTKPKISNVELCNQKP